MKKKHKVLTWNGVSKLVAKDTAFKFEIIK